MYQAESTRYQSMKYHYCGNSGLKLRAISLGLCTTLRQGIHRKYEGALLHSF